jgi:hypothetical protein
VLIRSFCALLLLACTTSAAFAQSLGTFRWQLQPYCNVLTLTVTQNSGVYTLDGFDDQCGAATVAPLAGTAVSNPNGTIELGLNIVASPGGAPVHVAVPLSITTLGGTWHDSLGNTGSFVFNPGTPAGAPRPAAPPPNQFPAGLVAGQTTFSADGGLVAGGTLGVGSVPPRVTGVRAMWLPAKGAFRAGYVQGEEWDDANVGEFSVAMGYAAAALERGAIALGHTVGAGAFGVAIGSNLSAGYRGVALGYNASATHAGATVIGDSSDANGANLRSTADNQFSVRAAGGYRLFSDPLRTAGVTLAPGASAWGSVSDVNMKENFRDLDGHDVLSKIANIPIREWNYKTQDAAIRHVGPTAQDFHAAFGLGEDPLRISTIDADGIALAGVKALALENRALKIELASLRERLERLERKQP